jgi:RNA polymerase sigma-70 factor (ECF subfamily)
MREKPSASTEAAEITRLILQHRNLIFGTILTQTADYNNAEDIFQDVCVTLCQKYPQFQKGTNFKSWVMEITRYKLLSHYQSRTSRNKVQLTPEIAGLMASSEIWLEEDPNLGNELAALRKCLGKVGEKNRLVLLNRFGKGLSCPEIAQTLGWTVNSVYVAISRLKDSLEKCVESQIAEGRT